MQISLSFLLMGLLHASTLDAAPACDKPALAAHIIDGTKSTAPLPFMAAIFQGGEYKCAGTILINTKILTAKHCLLDSLEANKWTVRVGSPSLDKGGQVLMVKAGPPSLHPLVRADNKGHTDKDIAILTLTSKIKLVKGQVAEEKLVKRASEVAGETVTIAGWGPTTAAAGGKPSPDLHQAEFPVIDRETCRDMAPNILLTKRVMCVANDKLRTSSLDSGASVLEGGLQRGIVAEHHTLDGGKQIGVHVDLGGKGAR